MLYVGKSTQQDSRALRLPDGKGNILTRPDKPVTGGELTEFAVRVVYGGRLWREGQSQADVSLWIEWTNMPDWLL